MAFEERKHNSTGRLKLSEYDQDSGRVEYLAHKAEKNITKAKVETVHPSRLLATQSWISQDQGGGGDPVIGDLIDHPVAARTKDGRLHLLDGHHRADNAAKSGRPIKVHVIDVNGD